jgi:hypothetical protein
MCILLVKDYLMGKKTRHCSLTMNKARLLEIPSSMDFLFILLEDISYPKIRSNGWTLHLGCGQH